MMHRGWHCGVAYCWGVFLALSGCSSYYGRVQTARSAFCEGDLQRAADQLQGIRCRQSGAKELLLADQAMVALLQGEPRRAEDMLRRVRDGWEHLDQSAVGENVARLFSDDRARAYAGEDYEKVMVRCFLALSNLMQDGSDVVPYCLQAVNKQEQIVRDGIRGSETNPKIAYPRVAISAYLHGVVQESGHRNFDDAERAYAAVVAWNPQFVAGRSDLLRATSGQHSAAGNGVVYVIAMTDPGPQKKESIAPVTSDALALASVFLRVAGDSNVPGLSAPVKIPDVVVAPDVVSGIEVTVDGHPVGVTETVTDINALAQQQAAATMPHTLARAVVRRVTKKSVVYAAKDHLGISPVVGLAMDAGSFAWEATESADVRCWNLLPGRLQVLRVELPQGRHTLLLQPLLVHGFGVAEQCDLMVEDGRNSYVLACFPGPKMSGKILLSENARP
ncbi:MAG: hypothetical protein O2931_16380 [Planctomycetota bacterium]|nr:hypothetical protein [Planctomycetota bacterium]MDA1180359.1 hypothetical protein [Planctomycetota bacterium]